MTLFPAGCLAEHHSTVILSLRDSNFMSPIPLILLKSLALFKRPSISR
jgi:hypothetical protein